MKALKISEAETVILALQDEIRRSEEARYDHRLHGVLLVAQGKSPPEVAHLLGDAPRTVEYWVHRFEEHGLAGLQEGERSGRQSRLTSVQLKLVDKVLRERPSDRGLVGNLWDGPTLRLWLKKECAVELSVRGCQRLFRQLNFRLRKPRPEIAPNDPEKKEAIGKLQATHKKTSETRSRPNR